MTINRRNLIFLFLADVVLFVLAGVTSKNSKHPGTVSNIFWFAFLIGAVLLIVLVLLALVGRFRRQPAG